MQSDYVILLLKHFTCFLTQFLTRAYREGDSYDLVSDYLLNIIWYQVPSLLFSQAFLSLKPLSPFLFTYVVSSTRFSYGELMLVFVISSPAITTEGLSLTTLKPSLITLRRVLFPCSTTYSLAYHLAYFLILLNFPCCQPKMSWRNNKKDIKWDNCFIIFKKEQYHSTKIEVEIY